ERTRIDLTIDFFRVPEGTVADLDERSEKWVQPRVEVRLVDGGKETVHATEVSLAEAVHFNNVGTPGQMPLKPWTTNKAVGGGIQVALATPLVWLAGPEAGPPGVGVLCAVPDPLEVSLDVSRDDLKRIEGVVAAVIAPKKP